MDVLIRLYPIWLLEHHKLEHSFGFSVLPPSLCGPKEDLNRGLRKFKYGLDIGNQSFTLPDNVKPTSTELLGDWFLFSSFVEKVFKNEIDLDKLSDWKKFMTPYFSSYSDTIKLMKKSGVKIRSPPRKSSGPGPKTRSSNETKKKAPKEADSDEEDEEDDGDDDEDDNDGDYKEGGTSNRKKKKQKKNEEEEEEDEEDEEEGFVHPKKLMDKKLFTKLVKGMPSEQNADINAIVASFRWLLQRGLVSKITIDEKTVADYYDRQDLAGSGHLETIRDQIAHDKAEEIRKSGDIRAKAEADKLMSNLEKMKSNSVEANKILSPTPKQAKVGFRNVNFADIETELVTDEVGPTTPENVRRATAEESGVVEEEEEGKKEEEEEEEGKEEEAKRREGDDNAGLTGVDDGGKRMKRKKPSQSGKNDKKRQKKSQSSTRKSQRLSKKEIEEKAAEEKKKASEEEKETAAEEETEGEKKEEKEEENEVEPEEKSREEAEGEKEMEEDPKE